MRVPLALALALTLALGGCIQNMSDLKTRLSADDEAKLQSASVTPAAGDELTPPDEDAKAPVARITIFGAGGVLLFKSTFVAEDLLSPLLVAPGENLTIMASDSEALEGKLTDHAWDLAGTRVTGSKAAASWTEPGVYPVRLVVTSENGLTDAQIVTLGIAPPAFNVTQNQTSAQIVGATVDGKPVGNDASVKFDVATAHAGKPAYLASVRLATVAADSCDVDVEVLDKDAKSIARGAAGGLGAAERIELGKLPEGTYTVKLTPGDACVARDGIRVSITETFVPLVDGVLLMAGHH